MKKNNYLLKPIALMLTFSILLTSCGSTTMINTNPEGAKIYLNEEPVGVTPYRHRDAKIVGSITDVRLEKEGYEPIYTQFSRDEKVDVGAIIGGILFLFPFLWTMKYKPTRTYEMIPLSGNAVVEKAGAENQKSSKAQRLRELKKLLDDEIITQDEFDREKKKILDGE